MINAFGSIGFMSSTLYVISEYYRKIATGFYDQIWLKHIILCSPMDLLKSSPKGLLFINGNISIMHQQ